MSAGAEPGPACYARGGVEPTVTDAHLVLGRMSGALLGDEFRLDRGAAETAIDRVASALGLTRERTAEGILDVANHAMVGAIRLVSVERGLDPRDFALLAFGGAGPLHGAQLARLLGMRTVIVPPNPGVLSAYGLLVADIRNDFSRTCLEQPPDYDVVRLGATFGELEAGARAWLDAEDVGPDDQSTEWSVSLRYKHQGFELTVPWNKGRGTEEALSEAVLAFHDLHEQLYTFSQVDTPVEVATLHVAAIGRLPRPVPAFLGDREGAGPVVLRHQSKVEEGPSQECPVYDRASLASGDIVQGPAVIAQHDSTTVVLPGQAARAHPGGSILIELDQA
jgi:N-methylhydantoinase A